MSTLIARSQLSCLPNRPACHDFGQRPGMIRNTRLHLGRQVEGPQYVWGTVGLGEKKASSEAVDEEQGPLVKSRSLSAKAP